MNNLATTTTTESTLSMTLGNDVQVKMPAADGSLPLVVSPNKSVNFLEWAREHRANVSEVLKEFGAILFRGFNIGGAQQFNDCFSQIVGDALEYKNRSSPRDQVFENVYTSTSHPKDQIINMHTEHSYSRDSVRIISFYCLTPPFIRGETPIADQRKLLKYLPAELLEEFRRKKILYTRNITSGIGLDWETTYQTSDRNVVNSRLKQNGIDYEWIEDDHLRLKWILPAFQPHPVTQEEMWYNHMYFYHASQYDPELLEYFGDENIPFSTYYGDGTVISNEVINEFRKFYKEHCIYFKWRKDDFLLLDNVMYAHGRNSYEGNRTVLTAMSQPFQLKV